MGLRSTFQTNTKLEREGRWFAITSVKNANGTHPGFKMARMHRNNPEYLAAIEKVSKEMRQAIDLDVLTEEIASPIMRRVFAETILLEWRNVWDSPSPGQPEVEIPYDKAAVDKLMTDLPDLYLLLVDEAKKLGNFRDAEVTAVAGKSSQQLNKPSGKDAT
jgi:hypothetical protein